MDGNGAPEQEKASQVEPRSLEQLLLAGLGWVSLTAEAVEEMADDLARRVGVEPERMRDAVQDVVAGWRREGARLGAMPADASEKALRRLGLVRREEMDDLALRVAQLEHRIRLLEKPAESPAE
jgi:polyhydroxyalkanoate synthesis regulator phasin